MINTVTFPGLGLEFTLNRVAFTLFGHNIYWYGVIIACGFLLALGYALWKAPKFGIDPDKIIDMLFFLVPLCIVGARAYYVIFNPSICFDENGKFSFYRMIALWDGGLAIYGAVLTAIVVVIVYCRARKQRFWDYADLCPLGVMIGQMVGRWGNFVNVEAYGGLTTVPWRMCSETIANWLWGQGQITDMDTYRAVIDGTLGVHPTFFYESVWNLIGFIILALLSRKRKFRGQNFAGYLIWYGFGRTLIEGLRTDSLYFFGTGLRASQLVGVISVIAGIVMLIVRSRTGRIAPETEAAGAAAEGESAPVEDAAPDGGGEEDAPARDGAQDSEQEDTEDTQEEKTDGDHH